LYSIDFDFRQEEWSDYLGASGAGTVYHTLEWRAVLEGVFHYETHYSVCRNERGACVGILPLAFVKSWITGNRVVSLPFSQYGGPLVSDAQALECIVRHLREYLNHGFEYVRFRPRDQLDEHNSADSGLKSLDYYTRCVIPLADRSEQDVRKSILKSRDIRRRINASSKEGIVVEIWKNSGEMDRMRDLMFQTCKKHGVPPYPPGLIKSISELFAAKRKAVIFVARLSGRIIATLVLFTVNKEGTYGYNFSDTKYLGFHPNHALLWAAIEWSIRNGLSAFDLGISSPQDNQLLLFKRRWGGSEFKVRDYFIASKDKSILPDRRASMKYKSATIAWRFLVPSYFASRLGPAILSHLD